MFCDELFDVLYMLALYVKNVSLYFVKFFIPLLISVPCQKCWTFTCKFSFQYFFFSWCNLAIFLFLSSSSSLSLQNLNRYRAFLTTRSLLLLLLLLLVWFFALPVLFNCLQQTFWFCVSDCFLRWNLLTTATVSREKGGGGL